VRSASADGVLTELRTIVDRYGGVGTALDAARQFAARAAAALDPLPDSPAKASLLDLAAFVLVRAR
jgi:geranylgeranyl pyrophosphate synthase